MYYVYVIANEEGNTYTGFTNDLERRLKEHNSAENRGHTKNDKWHYVYYEAYLVKEDAVLREKRLKSHGQSKRQLKIRIKHSLQMRE